MAGWIKSDFFFQKAEDVNSGSLKKSTYRPGEEVFPGVT
jgi:hypothetical protein